MIFSSFGRFLAIFLPKFSKMTEYNQFMFLRTLVCLNIDRLGLLQAFSVACFPENKFLTELNSSISAVQFSFTTTFHYLIFLRFRLYFKHRFFHKTISQWWKQFLDIFFHLGALGMETVETI